MIPEHAPGESTATGSSRVHLYHPRISDIRDAGYTCVDMHTHTVYSDSGINVHDLLVQAEHLGIGIAVTDHNGIDGVIEAYKAAPSVPFIPGIEVSALDGPHILLYFPAVPALADFFERYVRDARQGSPKCSAA